MFLKLNVNLSCPKYEINIISTDFLAFFLFSAFSLQKRFKHNLLDSLWLARIQVRCHKQPMALTDTKRHSSLNLEVCLSDIIITYIVSKSNTMYPGSFVSCMLLRQSLATLSKFIMTRKVTWWMKTWGHKSPGTQIY
jgi:hypothetical protein